PEAKLIFLYRNAGPWARSFLRLMRVPDPTAPIPGAGSRGRFGRAVPRLAGRETASTLEVLACLWLCVLEECLEMQRHGIRMFVARYEDLNAAPRELLAAMFAYCGLSANAVGNLDAVLEQDSQAGSPLSRASVGEAPAPVSPEHIDAV